MNKTCCNCKQNLSEENFSWKVKDKTRQARCKVCHSEYRKNHYNQNKDKYISKAKVNGKKRKEYLQSRMMAYLKDKSCRNCSVSNSIVLEFDHLDSETKVDSISAMISRGFSWPGILKEIKTCQILCATCHRIKTAKQFNWYKFQ